MDEQVYLPRNFTNMATLSTSGNQTTLIEKNRATITVSKRTVRFAKNVYQTKNVASFADGEVSIGQMPWWLVISAAVISRFGELSII